MADKYKDAVLHHLKKSEHFVDVNFLPNFQKDHDNSLLYKTDIYKGLIVTLKPDYEITSDDAMWLHPNNTQCRALFKGGDYKVVSELPATNASAGIYQTRTIDALGDEVRKTYTIVDTHLSQQWGGTVQSIYSNKYQAEVLENCKTIAKGMQSGEMVSAHFTNTLLKGTGIFHYYNCAYKDEGLVLHSPLVGYTMQSGKDQPADWIDENNHLTNLSHKQLDSIYSKCDWNSCELINTYAFKQCMNPVVSVQYQPIRVSLANTPVHDMLSPQQLVDMTPHADIIPDYMDVQPHARENKIKIPYSEETVLKLLELRNEHNILNMYNDGELTLPRHIIEKIA